ARRAQRAAGPRQCAGGARHRATRPGGGVVHGAGGDRRAVAANPRAQDRGLRSGHALPAGARCLGRRARARRAVKSPWGLTLSEASLPRTKVRSFPRKRESRAKAWVPAFAGTSGRECVELLARAYLRSLLGVS